MAKKIQKKKAAPKPAAVPRPKDFLDMMDRSVKEGFDQGWGVLLDKGTDVIQTDWPELLSRYRDSRRNGG